MIKKFPKKIIFADAIKRIFKEYTQLDITCAAFQNNFFHFKDKPAIWQVFSVG